LSFLQTTHRARKSRKLQRPNYPDPFCFEQQKAYHNYGADAEKDPIAFAVINVFFIFFHIRRYFLLIGAKLQTFSKIQPHLMKII
jgi:hypothetical protein